MAKEFLYKDLTYAIPSLRQAQYKRQAKENKSVKIRAIRGKEEKSVRIRVIRGKKEV